MSPVLPELPAGVVARRSLAHLQQVVAVDSSSDETSASIPSTPGQARLAEALEAFFKGVGARVERDDYANVIATLPARNHSGEPLALMVHLDTARGTHNVERLSVLEAWDGAPIPYANNDAIRVSLENYPSAEAFSGEDIVHGPGDAPFGLDDKLGLAHLMTLATLLAEHPEIPHPELIIVGRPDEEIGRMAAVEGLAVLLASRGVRSGYTIDGIFPFEINAENFNASQFSVWFAERPLALTPGRPVAVHLGGVNTHGATAMAEGHRAGPRLAAELVAAVASHGDRLVPVDFASDPLRDCDAVLTFSAADDAAVEALRAAAEAVMAPHLPRGASLSVIPGSPGSPEDTPAPGGACVDLLAWMRRFMDSDGVSPLMAEDSEGRQGYSHPFRVRRDGGGLRLDVRLRDFSADGLDAREDHLRALAGERPFRVNAQYINMGPKLAERADLVERAVAAGEAVGVRCPVQPIRGGTGVDPFLARGVAVANLGTGYFAPESEKEFTSLQMMERHARWLLAVVQGQGAGERR